MLTDFIRTGRYDRRREFHKTVSPSMDILVSSNLERYLLLASDCDFALVRRLMDELRDTGVYEAPASLRETMRRRFCAYCATDAEAIEAIGRVWREQEYLLDPHTAVAWVAMERFRKEVGPHARRSCSPPHRPTNSRTRCCAPWTARRRQDGFEAMDRLLALTGVPDSAKPRGTARQARALPRLHRPR